MGQLSVCLCHAEVFILFRLLAGLCFYSSESNLAYQKMDGQYVEIGSAKKG